MHHASEVFFKREDRTRFGSLAFSWWVQVSGRWNCWCHWPRSSLADPQESLWSLLLLHDRPSRDANRIPCAQGNKNRCKEIWVDSPTSETSETSETCLGFSKSSVKTTCSWACTLRKTVESWHCSSFWESCTKIISNHESYLPKSFPNVFWDDLGFRCFTSWASPRRSGGMEVRSKELCKRLKQNE